MRSKQIAAEASLAIAACEGDSKALATLANNIVFLEPCWKQKRTRTLERNFRLFLKAPSAGKLSILRANSLLYLFESEISKHACCRR